VINSVFAHFDRFVMGTKRHSAPQAYSASAPTRRTQQPYHLALSFTFVKCDSLRISIERHPARSVTEKFLGDLYIRSVLP
jgi:hypothetical protein